MAYFLLFIVSFGTGFVLDNAGNLSGGLFMGIFLTIVLQLYKQSHKMFYGWKLMNITKFWLGFVTICTLGLFAERVIFTLLQ